ncbi:hypothetical protein [Microvirga pudoricolor]|uniref:hypothetical protein n=1 Tax=Microvirga pudoricolor TaxID=2778729 RepID=UPI0019501E21|nr:hypothetical protein [Microvirga pudoricolor]MBM6593853.1 hypothetical protein [Microvirga pudoricolor]
MRLVTLWSAVRRIIGSARGYWRRHVSPDTQTLSDYILRDIGLDQHPGSRAEAWWRSEVIPPREVDDLRQ